MLQSRSCHLLWTLIFAFSCVCVAFAQQTIPQLSARVSDYTGTLSAGQKSQLEGTLSKLEQPKGSQVVVLIVPSTQPEAIEQYAMRVAENWKIGRKGVDDGVILLIAKQDRKLRIEVGYGLEGALNDAICKRIIEEIITPEFKQGRFFEGIDYGVKAIVKVINNEPLPEINHSSDTVAIVIVLLMFVVAFALTFYFSDSSSGYYTGSSSRHSSSGWGGGNGGGGFSGGGGSFGGGGASGGW